MITLYGIPNCDQIKKAKQWLNQHQVTYRFHDYRTDGVPANIADWIEQLGWQAIINRRSTSWKALSEQQRINMDNTKALEHINVAPTLVKRPLLIVANKVLVGFDEMQWQAAIDQQVQH